MKAKECLEALQKLMQERPELPVLPMVQSEIVCDDGYDRWTASWGNAYIDRYFVGEECVYFYDAADLDEMERALIGNLEEEEYLAITDDDKMREAYEKLPWIEAIIVNIDLPEE